MEELTRTLANGRTTMNSTKPFIAALLLVLGLAWSAAAAAQGTAPAATDPAPAATDPAPAAAVPTPAAATPAPDAAAPAPAAAAPAAAAAAPPPSPPGLGTEYTDKGADTCLMCHTEAWPYPIFPIFKTKHAVRSDARTPFGVGGLQCEACHGPGAKHVAGGGDKNAINNF